MIDTHHRGYNYILAFDICLSALGMSKKNIACGVLTDCQPILWVENEIEDTFKWSSNWNFGNYFFSMNCNIRPPVLAKMMDEYCHSNNWYGYSLSDSITYYSII